MEWHFTQVDFDGRNLKDPTESTVQSHGELKQLQIFVREVLQNALDNKAEGEQVQVGFRLNYLDGENKLKFLNAIQFDKVALHLKAVRDYQIQTKKRSYLPDTDNVLKDGYILKLLYIDDFGTRGLVGPEYEREKDQFPEIPHCFLGLCRNVGDSQKGTLTQGGTHGLGKTVLWKNSKLKLVMFYSRMRTPYKNEKDGVEHRTRFFGQIRLTGHDIGEQAYKGEGYFGNRQGNLTWSLFDAEADECANKLGMPVRNAECSGTSIVIVDFDDPDIEDVKETMEETARNIKEATEKYFWPAIFEEDLTVRSGVESNGKISWSTADVISQYYLTPYIEAYEYASGKKAVDDESATDMKIQLIEVTVPKGPEDEEKADASLCIATKLRKADTEFSEESMINRAALIRGSGMVIGYMPVARRGLAAKDYHTVVLGGRAFQPHPDVEANQERLEMMLAWAEPVTHDIWTDNTDALKQWYGARAKVREITNAIRKAISEVTVDQTPPEGQAAPLLASMFPIDTGPHAPPTSRDIHIEVIQPPHLLESGKKGELRYGFEIRIRIPARSNFSSKQKPDSWRVECKYGFYGEGRTRRIVAHAPVALIRVKKDEGEWEEIEEHYTDSAFYEDDVSEKETIYELAGETAALDPILASSTKHELEIRTERGVQEEVIE